MTHDMPPARPPLPPLDAPARPPASEDERELYRRFLAKRAEVVRARAAEQRERMGRATYETETRIARQLGEMADNGHGRCRWCGLTLGHVTGADGVEYRTHPPVRECPGPTPPPCELCGRVLWFDKAARDWTHECTAATRRAPVHTAVTRVQQHGMPGDGRGGMFGYRRGER